MTWYVRTANREFGPLSEQALRAIAATGQIDVKTLVRRSVTEEWVSVATLPGILPPASRLAVPSAPRPAPALRPESAPRTEAPLALLPDPPPAVAPAPRPASALRPLAAPPAAAPALTLEGLPIPVEVDIATPWRRFWARWLDVILGACLIGFMLGTVRPSFYQPGGFGAAHSQLFGWLVMPIVMLLDALIYALFGNTAGKAIAGIAVRDESSGGRLPFVVYLKRNFELYFLGLGTAFPIASLFTLYGSFRKADSGELLSWDLSADSRVIARSVNPVRTWVVAVVYIALVAGLTQLGTVEQRVFAQRQATNADHRKFAEKQLQEAADSLSQNAPRMIDAQTRLDRAELGAGLVFTYEYTLVDQRIAGLAPESLERFQRQIRQRLNKLACEEHKLDSLLRLATAVKYVYRDRDGTTVATAVMTSADCLH
jgi:uncharacterized RDD family membrane protein YckC